MVNDGRLHQKLNITNLNFHFLLASNNKYYIYDQICFNGIVKEGIKIVIQT